MLQKDELRTLRVTDLGGAGEGIGRADGFTLFVEGALPGDVVEARVVGLRKRFGYGKLVRVVQPSPDRVTPPCARAARCGCCALMALDYGAELRWKTKKVRDALARIGGFADAPVAETLGMAQPLRYRNKASFPVRAEDGRVAAGFFAPRSHRVTPVDDCLVHQPEACRALAAVTDFMAQYGVSAYDEAAHSGLVRHVLVRSGFAAGQVMVCVVVNGPGLPHGAELAEALARAVPGLAGVCVSRHTARTSVIAGEEAEVIWGQPHIVERLCGLEFEISPLSFFQVNPAQTAVLYERAAAFAQAGPGDDVIDLYCGVGAIALALAGRAGRVRGVERSPRAVEDARRNARRNGIANAAFFTGRADALLAELAREAAPDVVTLDPPRKGCEPGVLRALLDAAPARVVYVSCDPATLARDLKTLCAEGAYGLTAVQPVDCFPRTPHVESVCALERRAGP